MATGPAGQRGFACRTQVLALAVPLLLTVAVGCAGSRDHHAPESVACKVWANHYTTDEYHFADADTVSGLAQAMRGEAPDGPADKPLNVLCVSGGGKYAAFTAGALNGWSATGTRPTFDVAAGISSGAPVALMAFLGPKYDPLLAETFVKLHRADLYTWCPVRGIASGRGLMSSHRLEKLLEEKFDDAAMADLRSAHAAGRRLFIGTTNVLTHRLTVWDVGAIASSRHPDAPVLVRKVLLAACSIPGLVPPVEFDVTVNGVRYTELHADAGNLTQVFICTHGPLPPGSSVWVISAGKSHPNCAHGRPRILEAMVTAVSGSLYALFRADAMKLYALCGVTRSQFRMMCLPGEFQCRASSMVFDPGESQRMYQAGYKMARGGEWAEQPPDTDPIELPPPRTGVEFVTP